MGSMSRAAALLLLLRQARAGCDGNCAAPINVTCGSVLVVGDSTTAEYMPELRTLLSNLGVGHIYMANPASDGPCGSSFGLASCIEPYLEYAWSVIVLGWAHRDIKPNSYGVVTVSEYRTNLWETYTSLKGRLAPGGSMVFMTAVPVGASYEKRDNDDAKELNEEALQLFENEDITIIDHYARIVDACRRDPGLACYPETCDCARFQTDGVHGTSEGRWHKARGRGRRHLTLRADGRGRRLFAGRDGAGDLRRPAGRRAGLGESSRALPRRDRRFGRAERVPRRRAVSPPPEGVRRSYADRAADVA